MLGGLRKRIGFFIREIVFGFEDSLVSTLGVITGVAAGTQNAKIVIMTGCVLIVVEALSMSAGSYLSSKSAREVFESRKRQDGSRMLQTRLSDSESIEDALKAKKFSKAQILKILDALSSERSLWLKEIHRCEYRFAPAVAGSPITSGFVMGIFYLFGGLFPLAPYFFFSVTDAIIPSVGATIFGLFILGFAKAKFVGGHGLKSGFEMALVSMTAALIGFVIGRIVSTYFGIEVY